MKRSVDLEGKIISIGWSRDQFIFACYFAGPGIFYPTSGGVILDSKLLCQTFPGNLPDGLLTFPIMKLERSTLLHSNC